MFSFVIKRLLQAILVMLIVTMIAFLLFQFVGDPVTQMLGQEATEADRLALTHELGLDQPICDFSQVCERSSQWCELRYSQVQTAH